MKILTVIGTRPEIIRLSRIIPKLDKVCKKHILTHTGQSYDKNMSQVFFDELKLRQPDYYLGVASETAGEQIGKIMAGVEEVILKEKPDRLLVLGDTNSALSAFIARRMGVKVYHMEAGNRCFEEMPEEINRRVIDHSSDIHMPYTERSRANLLREGIASQQIFVTGNPIFEVLNNYHWKSTIMSELGLMENSFILVTAHREENVEDKHRLISLLGACSQQTNKYQVIFSRHPRTKKRMELFKFDFPSITFHEPFGFADFLTLERNAACVVTDSGTVQEECCILKIRCVTIRDTTERPETIECGSNILSGVETADVLRCINLALSRDTDWTPPEGYLDKNVSDKVVNILMGY